ncbi:MAG: enterochelin esterase, partial [Rhodanobacteraceae bacterium]
MRIRSWSWLLLLLVAPLAIAAQAPAQPAPHRLFRVTLDGASTQPASGRLLLFAIPAREAEAHAKGGKVTEVDTSEFGFTRTAVAAMDVTHLAPGQSVIIDADALAFPEGFSKLAAGDYDMQAVLDVNHDYNYSGRTAGDLVSAVTPVQFGDTAAVPSLRLTRELAHKPEPWTVPAFVPAKDRTKLAQAIRDAQPHARVIDFLSTALTQFWGRPMHIQGWVLLPPGYAKHPDKRYPTVYYTMGFGAALPDL